MSEPRGAFIVALDQEPLRLGTRRHRRSGRVRTSGKDAVEPFAEQPRRQTSLVQCPTEIALRILALDSSAGL